MQINKISETEIEIITQVSEIKNIENVNNDLESAQKDLADLEIRYTEQKTNLLALIDKYQSVSDEASKVGVVFVEPLEINQDVIPN